MKKRMTEAQIDREIAERVTHCEGGKLDDAPWEGFALHNTGDPEPFERRWHHDGLADGYGDDLEDHESAFATSYVLGHFASDVWRVVDATGTWERLMTYGGETEVPCPFREWDPVNEESAPMDAPFVVTRHTAQLEPRGLRTYRKRPKARNAFCPLCDAPLGDEHGFLGNYLTVELWKKIADLPGREELVEKMARTAFVEAYAAHVEDPDVDCTGCDLFGEDEDHDHVKAGPRADWFDVLAHLDTPEAADQWAEKTAREIEAAGGGGLPALYLYACALPGKNYKDPTPDEFAFSLAMQVMGHGVGWGDNHPKLDFDLPRLESLDFL